MGAMSPDISSHALPYVVAAIGVAVIALVGLHIAKRIWPEDK